MSSEWLYLQLYPGDLAAMDALVAEVVAPAVASARAAAPVESWFFLRYLDEDGAHVRLRLRGSAAALDRAHAAIEATLAASQPRPWVRLDLYEPELAKYGGAAGVALAEAVFEASSALALAALPLIACEAQRRVVAGELMRRSADALLPRAAHAEFWGAYARYWRAGEAGIVRRAGAPPPRRARPPQLEAAMDGYLAALSPGRLRADLACFHHVHMTNNRLGVYPHEEAVLAADMAGVAVGT